MTARRVAGLAGILLLTGCMVGPDYHGAPVVAPHEAAAGAFTRAGKAVPAAPPAQWWRSFGDPELDHLVDAALAGSPDVAAAEARLRQSRAGLRQARANLFPTSSASALDLRMSGVTSALGGAPLESTAGSENASGSDALNLYAIGFDASWELDLFGGERRAVEGNKAQLQASQADLQGAIVSLTADVAQAYVALREAQQRLALSRQAEQLDGRILQLTGLRRAGGTATDADIEQARSQWLTQQAQSSPLEAQIAAQLDRLAVLTAREPGALDAELGQPGIVPLPPAEIAVGDPAALLRRRPDIRAAERRLAADTAFIGQHVADLFPKLTLLGTLGLGSTNASQLFNSNSFSYLTAPMLQWSPLDFGRNLSKVDQARAQRDEALADYRSTVLSALGDAETALSRYGHQAESFQLQTSVAASAQRTATLTAAREAGGTATRLDLWQAQTQSLSAAADLEQAKATLTQDYIALQKSLGLGWEAPPE